MILHHIAIGTQNLERLNEFYSRLPGVKNIEKKYSPEGYFRSFWIRFEGNILLMVEEKEKNKGPEALIFSIFNDNGNPFDLTSIQDLI
ncbi:MAG: hypothetical protein KDK36_01565 [Leptospiraceae bacterium]|nr:hypothetical protein [Leptospiraceae bacterium]